MFGYVRPCAPELRVRELEAFKACYCGLCHALGTRYGFAARFVLGYDFVFLAMLLTPPEADMATVARRCPVRCRKKRCYAGGAEMTGAAGRGVILAYHKLRDNADDEALPKSLASRAGCVLLGRAYRRAAADFPAFDKAVRARLTELDAAEADPSTPLDGAADCFARLLAAAGEEGAEPGTSARRRILESLLYQLGRWIYLIDARDDLAEDAAKRRPNAIALRESAPDDARLRLTLAHSASLAASAFELLPDNVWSEVLRNILYLGLPQAQDAVFAGTWKTRTRGLKL
ncbi:MAG: DUF5685 family protein [Oscillospiraceae bacterium]|nr:DUF5685 family protein [Oscillospiraceae bacterium]